MKIITSRRLVGLLALGLLASGVAAEKKKKKAPVPPTVDTTAVALLKPYDKDADYEISKAEMGAIQADYKASPDGPLKALDLAHDGTLDDIDRLGINNKLGAAKMVEQPEAPKKGKK